MMDNATLKSDKTRGAPARRRLLFPSRQPSGPDLLRSGGPERCAANGSFSIAAEVNALRYAMRIPFQIRSASADVAARGSCFSSRSTRGRLLYRG